MSPEMVAMCIYCIYRLGINFFQNEKIKQSQVSVTEDLLNELAWSEKNEIHVCIAKTWQGIMLSYPYLLELIGSLLTQMTGNIDRSNKALEWIYMDWIIAQIACHLIVVW